MDWYKGMMLIRYAAIVQAAPRTSDKIMAVLKGSAAAAVKVCEAGDTGDQCLHTWGALAKRATDADPKYNAMIQTSAVNAISALLGAKSNDFPATNTTAGHASPSNGGGNKSGGGGGGGQSKDNSSAGGRNYSLVTAFTGIVVALGISFFLHTVIIEQLS